MTSLKFLLALSVILALALPAALRACPSCSEAPAAMGGGEDDEQSINNPEAYNQSIYVMVGVPYFCLAVLGVCVYRGMKKNEAFRRAHESQELFGHAAPGAPIADQAP
jgi:hypothetical protein